MRKYHCLGALFISLLLCACSDTAGATGKTDMELNLLYMMNRLNSTMMPLP